MIDSQIFYDAAEVLTYTRHPYGKVAYLDYCMKQVPDTGHLMEFGVWQGNSLRGLCNGMRPRTVWGFDSWEGLPEKWDRGEGNVYPVGRFSMQGKMVETLPANAKLVKGYFEDTLPAWLEANPGDIALLHIDSDLYSSAMTVLSLADSRLKTGSVIMFDELIDFEGKGAYSNWREGEWRALCEWVEIYGREFMVIARTQQYQAAIRVM